MHKAPMADAQNKQDALSPTAAQARSRQLQASSLKIDPTPTRRAVTVGWGRRLEIGELGGRILPYRSGRKEIKEDTLPPHRLSSTSDEGHDW
ncbi:hypothetical protein AMELA_G00197450 [Ameiurus melas]|uniref:Uncharacterized protein n=1 Tax=Ameiurus melas TaxID=219545 RepID=A0A7J6A618_AMEME|nr:hypothetical protein AMELA_G00197450 [Ameiurus melas]